MSGWKPWVQLQQWEDVKDPAKATSGAAGAALSRVALAVLAAPPKVRVAAPPKASAAAAAGGEAAEGEHAESLSSPAGAPAVSTIGSPGALLKYCDAALAGGKLAGELEAAIKGARQEAMEQLGWGWAVAHEAAWETLNKPKAHALF